LSLEINKIICGDSLEILKTFTDNFVDLTITSPPYNFNKGSGLGTKYKNGYKDNLSYKEYYKWQRDCIKEFLRISKLTFYNIQFIAGNSQSLLMLMGRFYKDIKEVIIWDKVFSEPAANEGVLNSQFELIIVFEKDTNGRKFKECNFDKGTLPNLWKINKMHNWKSLKKNDYLKTNNTAVFPLDLPLKIINNFSKEGDLILDPFNGTGQTCLSAVMLKRSYIGIDVDKSQCELSEKKIDSYLRQERIF